MPAVVFPQGLFLLDPGTRERAARRGRDARRVLAGAVARPQHHELARLRPVQPGAVGDVRVVALALEQLAEVATAAHPVGLGGVEQLSRRADRCGEVVPEPHQVHAAVRDLDPLVGEDHVGHAVLHPQRAVERHPVGWRLRAAAEGPERALGTVGHEDLGPALQILRASRRGGQGLRRREGHEQVVPAVVAVHLRGPDRLAPPVAGRHLEHRRRRLPGLEVLAGVDHDRLARLLGVDAVRGGAVDVVRLRGGVGQDEGVADAYLRPMPSAGPRGRGNGGGLARRGRGQEQIQDRGGHERGYGLHLKSLGAKSWRLRRQVCHS